MYTHTYTHIHYGILFSQNMKEILPLSITWMNLEGIMLSEISQIEKDKYCVLSVISGILKRKKLIS